MTCVRGAAGVFLTIFAPAYPDEGHANKTVRAVTPATAGIMTLGILLFYQTGVTKSMVESPREAFHAL